MQHPGIQLKSKFLYLFVTPRLSPATTLDTGWAAWLALAEGVWLEGSLLQRLSFRIFAEVNSSSDYVLWVGT